MAAGLQLRPGLRLVFPLLSRPRAVPRARRHAARHAARRPSAPRTTRLAAAGRCRRTGAPALNIASQIEFHRHAVPARRRLRRSGLIYSRVAAIPGPRRRASTPTRSPTSRSATARTSEGEFWEALNTACTRQLPVLFLVEDNGYAISVPVEVQTPGGDISRLVQRFPDLHVHSHATAPTFWPAYRTMREAVAYVRARKGPAFVHATRHAAVLALASDDERLYKTAGEREAEARRDPIVRLRELLMSRARHATKSSRTMLGDVEREVNEAADSALAAPQPTGHRDALRLLARRRSGLARRSTRRAAHRRQAGHDGRGHQPHVERRDGARPAHRRLRRGRGRRQPRGRARGRPGQGRRVQGHARPAARFRRRSRVQLAARRGQHHRPRRRHGAARPEAGGRDPVLRLHLAGVHADPRRAVDDALPVGQPLVVPGGDSRADRRLFERRSAVPQPVGRGIFAHCPGIRIVFPSNAAGRGRPAAHRHPLRRPGALPRAQAPLPADLQQGAVSRTPTS